MDTCVHKDMRNFMKNWKFVLLRASRLWLSLFFIYKISFTFNIAYWIQCARISKVKAYELCVDILLKNVIDICS